MWRACILSVASIFVGLFLWLAFSTILNGLSADLMGFEQEPAQGWNYWRWFFIKRNLSGILGTVGIPTALGVLVVWRWIALARDIRRGKYRQKNHANLVH